ncbi:MAG: hypothetical protein H6667_07915 [Ardenticatenaceae bacterium]|nr:hypothetical protein [Ardenticatenaceae bacterium]
MDEFPIFLIASDTNLRFSLCSILKKAHFVVQSSAYLCVEEIQSASYALFVYAIRSVQDANLAGAYLQDDACLTTPIIFLCEPVFVSFLQQSIRSCCRVEILITPLAPQRIIEAVQDVLKPCPANMAET